TCPQPTGSEGPQAAPAAFAVTHTPSGPQAAPGAQNGKSLHGAAAPHQIPQVSPTTARRMHTVPHVPVLSEVSRHADATPQTSESWQGTPSGTRPCRMS